MFSVKMQSDLYHDAENHLQYRENTFEPRVCRVTMPHRHKHLRITLNYIYRGDVKHARQNNWHNLVIQQDHDAVSALRCRTSCRAATTACFDELCSRQRLLPRLISIISLVRLAFCCHLRSTRKEDNDKGHTLKPTSLLRRRG